MSQCEFTFFHLSPLFAVRKLEKLGIVKAVIALHDQQKLGALAQAWYAKGQFLGQPLGELGKGGRKWTVPELRFPEQKQ